MRLNDVFDWKDGKGIFYYISKYGTMPWTVSSNILDIQYHANHSGNKLVAPIVENLLNSSHELENLSKETLGSIIYSLFIQNWTKLYNTLSLQYNPISNYDMTEEETSSGTHSNSGSNTKTGTESDNTTGTGTNNSGIYGFNSVTAVDSNTATSSVENENTHTYNTTDSNSESGTDSGTRTLTRSGNIGVTTSQQMIQSERDVWIWKFYDQVFKDIDSILVLEVY